MRGGSRHGEEDQQHVKRLAPPVNQSVAGTRAPALRSGARAGVGAGSDCLADADGTAELASTDKGWVDVGVTETLAPALRFGASAGVVQAWVTNPADNHGLVLLAQAASGNVTYNFCSELGWAPCTPAQAPVLVVWHHEPAP